MSDLTNASVAQLANKTRIPTPTQQPTREASSAAQAGTTADEKSREELIDEFERGRVQNEQFQQKISGGLSSFRWDSDARSGQKNKKTKKNKNRNQQSSDSSPVFIKQLVAGNVHSNRHLLARVVVSPYRVTSIHAIVEDDFGCVAKLCIYNDADVNKYKMGTKMRINDPYFKIGGDGKFMLRVDDPSTIKAVSKKTHIGASERTSSEWKDLANECFRAKNYLFAVRCYSRGIHRFKEETSNVAIDVFNNRSLCYLKLKQLKLALLNIVACKYVDENVSFKTWYREIRCLNEMGHSSAALAICKQAIERFPDQREALAAIELVVSSSFQQETDEKQETPDSKIIELDWDVLGVVVSDVLGVDDSGVDDSKDEAQPDVGLNRDAVRLKQAGNDAYNVGNYETAIRHYSRCLVLHCEFLSTLFSNRAAASICSKEYKLAFQDATIAVIINPQNVKGWYRRCISSYELKLSDIGDAICKEFEEVQKNETFIKFMKIARADQKRERSDQKMQSAAKYNDSWTLESNAGEIMRAMIKNNTAADKEAVEAIELVQRLPTHMRSKLLYDIPKFHEIYAKRRQYPHGADIAKCKEILWRAYEHGRALKAQEFRVLSSAYEMSPGDKTKRRALSSNRMRWLTSAKIGAIHDMDNVSGYPRDFFHSFGTAPESTVMMYSGQVHIAVGFCDLFLLTRMSVQPSDSAGPVRFVGVDMSLYSVAKSIVIREMLANPAIAAESILEVWYSATWTKETNADFCAAVETIVKTQRGAIEDDVFAYIEHWFRAEDVSVETARTLWLESITRSYAEKLCNFQNMADTLDFAQYVLSGDVLPEKGKSMCGNVTMFDNIASCPKKAKDELVHQALSLSIVPLWEKTKSLKKSVYSTILQGIQRLKGFVLNKTITIELIHGCISLDNPKLIKRLQRLKPYSVSWSNCIDYMAPPVFHDIAKQIGHEDCVHVAYSMNWALGVRGTYLIDYPEREARVKLFRASEQMTTEHWAEIRLDKKFRVPSIDNPMYYGSMASMALFKEHWVSWFLGSKNTNGAAVNYNEESVWTCHYNPIGKSNCTINFFWTYDEELPLQSLILQ